MMEEERHPHYGVKALARLSSDKLLVRQCSAVDEAITKGDGHLYFTHPDGKPFPTASGRYVIDRGLVVPIGDGLFGDSQTYRIAS